ncbi:dihydrofolate reductase family protein [Actinomycetospora straminea]|uniref:Dihydrofolate reductase family protein n=1 Tax=Actinomycetospora straminea TaxID=663607 RepID=A0ABP9EKZ5_9PSEU|nr:dihydrofolate reductase family protein [Actinomycetospora straminea]MDD7935066.1 dihydrofolate reductase family protein [Actinomycetospora straminea]
MRIVVTQFTSLDGVTQAPGGADEDTDGGFAHGGWSVPYFDETLGATWDRSLRDAEAMLFGRRTWEVSAAVWPHQTDDPFADRINGITKYVASRTLTEADLTWENSHLLPTDDTGDAVGAVRDLRERAGGDLLVQGSASLATALADADLVDEYRLMIEPILLGGGKGVFPTSRVGRAGGDRRGGLHLPPGALRRR